MPFLLAVLPIVLLVYVMTKARPWPSHMALPFAALLVYLTSLIYFRLEANLANATLLKGALASLTPISIIWGAILLSLVMQRSGAENVIRHWLNGVSPNPVAQLMIIGWAFAFMIEGASGFGTPAAIAAPVLVGLGFPPIRVAILTLIMNTVPVSFGAVGTPMWFGFSPLSLEASEVLTISWKCAFVHTVAALIVPVIALCFVVSWKEVRKNLGFVYLSILSCVIPYAALACFNYEFPALVGGAVGLGLSTMIAKKGLGLFRDLDETPAEEAPQDRRKVLKAFMPYFLMIAVLILTRIKILGVRDFLNSEAHGWSWDLGSLGLFSVSEALVIKLSGIFGTASAWEYKALYVPAIIPFVLVVLICIPLFKLKWKVLFDVANNTSLRLQKPAITLVGALIMVELMMVGGEKANTMIIGKTFADLVGNAWPFCAAFLGALGSFFSGSATVSNLTFGGIQNSIAATLNFNHTTILALQSVGGAMGNMVCINNIIAVCTIIGLTNQEGYILKRTIFPLLIYGMVAAAMSFVLRMY